MAPRNVQWQREGAPGRPFGQAVEAAGYAAAPDVSGAGEGVVVEV